MPPGNEYRKQSEAVAAADRNDPDLFAWPDAALADYLADEGEGLVETALMKEY
ncbi:hypothetical protein J2T08_000917 [Neorhizobium galegae]|uniref:hypothetical protein n=1 Tax=Neorhizobium galegae TaxID=399 RepID=UPI002783D551|nr:hypothetical protein [Neorhizobium galegae]MDQ0133016.1 hypothetical protein [Neorhizobium galegae]